jgi:uncharacterized protein (TIGR02186 family)
MLCWRTEEGINVCRRLITSTILLLAGLLGGPPLAVSAVNFKAELKPSVIHIGAFYDGQPVSVSGVAPATSEVVVRVTGKRQDLELKKKGRALGIFWMNLDNVSFHKVPELYLLFTSKEFREAVGTNPGASGMGMVGLESLEGQIEIKPTPADRHALFRELLKLKESEGLYAVRGDAVHYEKAQGPIKHFVATVLMPSRLTPGDYLVETFALNHGEIVAKGADELKVDQVGLPALLSSLAFEHGGLYGILATLIAVAAGLLMGFLFKGSKGAH